MVGLFRLFRFLELLWFPARSVKFDQLFQLLVVEFLKPAWKLELALLPVWTAFSLSSSFPISTVAVPRSVVLSCGIEYSDKPNSALVVASTIVALPSAALLLSAVLQLSSSPKSSSSCLQYFLNGSWYIYQLKQQICTG